MMQREVEETRNLKDGMHENTSEQRVIYEQIPVSTPEAQESQLKIYSWQSRGAKTKSKFRIIH